MAVFQNNFFSLLAAIALFIIAGLVITTNNQLHATQEENAKLLSELIAATKAQSRKIGNMKLECSCTAPVVDIAEEGYPGWMEDTKKRQAFFGSLHGVKPEPLSDEMPTGSVLNGGNVNGQFEPLALKVDLKKYKRKIFLDLGGRDGDSAHWFMENYPDGKDYEIIIFEADPTFNVNHTGKPWTYFNYAVWIRNETMLLGDAGIGSSIVAPNQGTRKEILAIDFSEYVNKYFDLDDFIVCKMDIEGAEFQVVPKMLADLTLFKIDELMLECHYFEWTGLIPGISREDCLAMNNNLRAMNFYVHEWT